MTATPPPSPVPDEDVEALARIVCPRSLAHGRGDMWCRRKARAILSDPALASVLARAATRHEDSR